MSEKRWIELFERLVAFDTTSHRSNLELIDYVADRLDDSGAAVWRDVSPDGRKANLLCRVGSPRDDRSGLTLCGHTDVVPANEEGWESDPFRVTPSDEAWTARGSCDMKGFLALAVDRFLAVRESDLAAPLALLLTYDEEVGSLGVQHLAEGSDHEALPRAMLIGEPTELRPIRMHKGHLRLRLETFGQSAHSGYPDRGRSAIEPAGRIVQALADLRRELAAERPPGSEHFPRVPFVALNVATIAGGSAVNVIPDRCAIELGVRLLPGVSSAEIEARIRDAVEAVAGDTEWRLTVGNLSPPLAVDPDAPVHRHLCEHVGAIEGGSADFSSDGGTLGDLGFDCVLYGPGSIEVAHRPNEFLPRSDLLEAATTVDRMIDLHCRTPD